MAFAADNPDPPARGSRNRNCPFWFLVAGAAAKVSWIWSFIPERSTLTPVFERVVPTDLRHVVRPHEHEVVPGTGVRAVVDRREALEYDVWHLFGVQFGTREEL